MRLDLALVVCGRTLTSGPPRSRHASLRRTGHRRNRSAPILNYQAPLVPFRTSFVSIQQMDAVDIPASPPGIILDSGQAAESCRRVAAHRYPVNSQFSRYKFGPVLSALTARPGGTTVMLKDRESLALLAQIVGDMLRIFGPGALLGADEGGSVDCSPVGLSQGGPQ